MLKKTLQLCLSTGIDDDNLQFTFFLTQKKKLEMKKLENILKPEEYAAAISTTGLNETQGRLANQYLAIEEEYRRVLQRMEQDS